MSYADILSRKGMKISMKNGNKAFAIILSVAGALFISIGVLILHPVGSNAWLIISGSMAQEEGIVIYISEDEEDQDEGQVEGQDEGQVEGQVEESDESRKEIEKDENDKI